MAKIYGTPLMMGGSGGANKDLPPLLDNFKAFKGGGTSENPHITIQADKMATSRANELAGAVWVYADHEPTSVNDGTKIQLTREEVVTSDGGEAQTVTKTVEWNNEANFFARQFTYNSKKQYQTMLAGAVASVIVEGAPANVTDFQISGSGASPVLSWVNPIDDELYQETVVIQKQDSEPTDITDGTEIYRGTDETCTATGLEQSTDYYFAIYTVSSLGVYRQPVVKSYRFNFPEPPTSYIEVTRLNNSETWIVPENGYFKFIGVAASGDGGSGLLFGINKCGGGSGGSGGITVSILKLYKGQEIQLKINAFTTVVKFGELNAISRAGGNGFTSTDGDGGKGGTAGSAEGGNQDNIAGKPGNKGNSLQITGTTAFGGSSVTTSYQKYSTASGYGGSCSDYGQAQEPGKGTNGYVAVLRGNTNTPSPSQASVLSLIPKNNSVEATWKNSGDPVQTGTMLVYNTSHTPKAPSDGVAVDIPLTQPVTLALNSDSEELQEDFKKQSYTITGVPNDKPVFVALFPYDKDRKYGLPKADVEIPRVHSWYDTQQELKAEVETVKTEMADYQSYYTTTQEVLK